MGKDAKQEEIYQAYRKSQSKNDTIEQRPSLNKTKRDMSELSHMIICSFVAFSARGAFRTRVLNIS